MSGGVDNEILGQADLKNRPSAGGNPTCDIIPDYGVRHIMSDSVFIEQSMTASKTFMKVAIKLAVASNYGALCTNLFTFKTAMTPLQNCHIKSV